MRGWFAVETSLDLIGTNIGAELEELYLPQVVDTALVRRWRQSSGVCVHFQINIGLTVSPCCTVVRKLPDRSTAYANQRRPCYGPPSIPRRRADMLFPSKSVQSLANTNKLDMPQRR